MEQRPAYVELLEKLHERLISIEERFHDRLVKIEERLDHHCSVEHKDFDGLMDVVRGGRIAAKVLGIFIGVLAGAATALAWIKSNLNITIK